MARIGFATGVALALGLALPGGLRADEDTAWWLAPEPSAEASGEAEEEAAWWVREVVPEAVPEAYRHLAVTPDPPEAAPAEEPPVAPAGGPPAASAQLAALEAPAEPAGEGSAEGSVEPEALEPEAEEGPYWGDDDWDTWDDDRAAADGSGAETTDVDGTDARDEDVENRCRRLWGQLERYSGDLELAKEREDEVWEAFLERHLERVEAEARRRCPPLEGPDPWMIALRMAIRAAELAYKAAKIAAMF